MKQLISVGVIGCGVIAPTHIEHYNNIDGVQVTWACDLVEEKAKGCAEVHGIPNVTSNYHEVLADESVDCISVCTDHASHASITVDALQKGKHVLCEKALAATVEGLDRMCAAQQSRRDLVWSGVFQHRFDPIHRYVKDLVEKEIFGSILTAGVQMRCLRTEEYYHSDVWRGTWAKEGGSVLINQAIHYIDLLVWIMGGVHSVSGAYANITHQGAMETEDTAVAALKFNSGALGTLEATCSSHIGWEPTLSIHGSTGSLDLRHDKILKIAFDDPSVGRSIKNDLEQLSTHTEVAVGKTYYGVGHAAQIADFIGAVRKEHGVFIPGTAARHTVEVVLAIYRSHDQQQWVEVS